VRAAPRGEIARAYSKMAAGARKSLAAARTQAK